MAETHSPTVLVADHEIVITRLLNAPRPLVWKAWTTPEHLIQWWGPNGFTNTFQEIDVRPGGIWRFIMHGPDGVDYQNRIVFDEIVEPERILYTHGSDESPEQFRASVTFREEGEQTRVTLRTIFATAEERQKVVEFGAIEGGKQTLGRLDAYLATM